MHYTKHVSRALAVQLALDDSTADHMYAEVVFGHTQPHPRSVSGSHGGDKPGTGDLQNDKSDSNGTSGAHDGARNTQSSSGGWFSGLWGKEADFEPLSGGDNDEAHLSLGYIQVFGAVILNYKFEISSSGLSQDGAAPNAAWWSNSEYASAYRNTEEDDDRDLLDAVPFIQENTSARLAIGNKLGGINDLVLEDNHSHLTIDGNKRYFIQDLLYNFNTYKMPKLGADVSHTLPLKDMVNNIVPFYTTSQSLLFTDLQLKENTKKTFHLKIPKLKGVPPSYNAHATGIMGDQGVISIKYFVVVGFQRLDGAGAVNIYFPLDHKGERVGQEERWLQHDYLQKVVVDKSWHAEQVDESENALVKKTEKIDLNTAAEGSRETFLQDLDKLINSDLYNMPKISTYERRKSVNGLQEPDDSQHGLIPQLPARLKNQFSILVNQSQLCLLELSKPYCHLGESLAFTVHVNTRNSESKDPPNRVVGLVVHLEAHEVFHVPKEVDPKGNYTNIYRVSPSIKFNSLATAMLNVNKSDEEQSPSLLNGNINIPRSLSQQFQCSKLMDLKYYMVFKFNLMKFDKDTTKETDEHETEGARSDSKDTQHLHEVDPFESVQSYKFYNIGTEFRFRLPVSILP